MSKTMRRLVAIVLVLSMVTAVLGAATVFAYNEEDDYYSKMHDYEPFDDVPENAFYNEPVLWGQMHGFVTGTTDTTFEPKKQCTRGELLTFMWRACGKPEPETKSCPFTDVQQDRYYYKAVLWAYERGITKGTTETTFSPAKTCTRAEAVTFLWRMEDCYEVGGENPFTDVPANRYYYKAVLFAYTYNITTGTTATTFSPDKVCTRGEMITFLSRLFILKFGF